MSAVSQATVSASSTRRGGCAVQLSPQVVNGLSSDLEKLRSSRSTSPREITGLLYGTAEDGLVSVKAFKALSARVSRQRSLDAQVCSATEFESSLAASGNDTSSLQLIGWYCLRLGKNPGLLDSDVEFHNEHFPRRTDLALVLRPEHKTDLVMELYSRTPEGLLSSTEHRWTSLHLPTNVKVDEPIELVMRSRLNDDFYMRAYQVGRSLERAERNEEWKRRIEFGKTITTSLFQGTLGRAAQIQRKARILIAAPGAAESGKSPASSTNAVSLYQRFDPASTGLPAVRSTQKPPIPWFSSAVIFVFVAGACATFSILYIQNRSMAHRGAASQHQESIIPAPILGLHVQTQADRLLVTWNRSSFTARTAGNGVLVIDDGSSHRELPLDSGQVADGSVLYKPGSDDVSFRLELFGDRDSATTESVRVLDGT